MPRGRPWLPLTNFVLDLFTSSGTAQLSPPPARASASVPGVFALRLPGWLLPLPSLQSWKNHPRTPSRCRLKFGAPRSAEGEHQIWSIRGRRVHVLRGGKDAEMNSGSRIGTPSSFRTRSKVRSPLSCDPRASGASAPTRVSSFWPAPNAPGAPHSAAQAEGGGSVGHQDEIGRAHV